MSQIFTANDIYGNNTSLRNNLLNLTEKYGEITLTGLDKKQRYQVYSTMSFPLKFKKIGGTRNQDKDILVNNVSTFKKNIQKENINNEEISNTPRVETNIIKNIVRINSHIADMFEVHHKLIWFFVCTMFIDIYVNFLEMYYRYELFQNTNKQECYINNTLDFFE